MTLFETVETQVETTLDFLKTEKAAPLAKEFLGWHAGRIQILLVDMWEDEKVQAVLAKRQGQGQVEKEQLIEALELIEVVKEWAHDEGTTEEGKALYMAGINDTICHLEQIEVKHSTLITQWFTFLVDVAEIVNEDVHQDLYKMRDAFNNVWFSKKCGAEYTIHAFADLLKAAIEEENQMMVDLYTSIIETATEEAAAVQARREAAKVA